MSNEPPEPSDSRPTVEFSLTPVLNRLLKPSADLLGKELRDGLRVSIDAAKKAWQENNVKEHIRRVFREWSPTENADGQQHGSQLLLFDEWVKGAENVEADDSPLAQIWQGLLREIANGRLESGLLLEKLKKLTPLDAYLLLTLARRRQELPEPIPLSPFGYSPLEQLHIAEMAKDGLVVPSREPQIFAAIASIFIVVPVGWYAIRRFSSADTMITVLLSGACLTVFALIGSAALLRMGSAWRLSWIGTELVSKVTGPAPTSARGHWASNVKQGGTRDEKPASKAI